MSNNFISGRTPHKAGDGTHEWEGNVDRAESRERRGGGAGERNSVHD